MLNISQEIDKINELFSYKAKKGQLVLFSVFDVMIIQIF